MALQWISGKCRNKQTEKKDIKATEYPIHIYPDYTIAQLVFEELEEVPSSEKLYKNREDVHYQNENGAFRGAKFDDKFLDSIWDEMLN